MPRYYDNDAYREELMSIVYEELASDPDNCRANRIIDAFDRAPEADVAPVVQGRWNKYVCSACGGYSDEAGSDYCCNCGARMEGVERDV